MATPLDAITTIHKAFRRDIAEIDDAAYKAAAGDGDLSVVVDRLRFFSEILRWHADGEEKSPPPAAALYAASSISAISRRKAL